MTTEEPTPEEAGEPYLAWIPAQQAPEDIVPHPRLAGRELARRLLRLDKQAEVGWGLVTIPGEPVLDAQGDLIGVTPSREEWQLMHPAVVTLGEIERAGLQREDVPHLRVLGESRPRRSHRTIPPPPAFK